MIFVRDFIFEELANGFLVNHLKKVIDETDTSVPPSIFKLNDKKFIEIIKNLTEEKKFRNDSGIYKVDVCKVMAS